jgi:hypothetical protein
MAMPTIGGGNCIGLRSCPNSLACSAIGQAVCPGTSSSISLSDMSIRAGKSAPHGIAEFSAYNPNYVSLLSIGSVGTDGVSLSVQCCHCLVYSYTRTVGNTYCVCLTADLFTSSQTGAVAAFCVTCNAVSTLSCQIGPSSTVTTSVSFVVDSNDAVIIRACASVPSSGIGCSRSFALLTNVTPIVGQWSCCGLTGCRNHDSYTV